MREVTRPTHRQRRPREAGSQEPQLRSRRYRRITNPFPPLRIFSDDAISAIHQSALRILADEGMRILLPAARHIFSRAGAIVDEAHEHVRIGADIVAHGIAQLRPSTQLIGGSPERNVPIGGSHVAVVPVAGPPNVSDRVRGRRPGTLEDFRDFIRLSQMCDVIHLLGPSVEAQDVPVELRHLDLTLAQLTLSDKVPFVWARGTAQVADCFAMIRLAHALDEAGFQAQPHCWTNINTNSPRQLDAVMAQGVIDFAAAGQLTIITPFTLAGAMAPITLAGALTLAHAEALMGIVLAQLVRPGAPVVYGGFTSNVDMKSGSPAFGTPEFVKASLGTGQLARHLGLPWRGSNATGSAVADEQATYESAMSLWGTFMGGVNVLVHGAGWLEGGLVASFEKFILDVEMLQMMAEILQPVPASCAEIGLEAIAEVAPGGHFFSTAHTLERYRDAFYAPMISDWSNYGQWVESGERTAAQRATSAWQRMLQEFTPPARDAERIEALEAFAAKRRAEGGASPAA